LIECGDGLLITLEFPEGPSHPTVCSHISRRDRSSRLEMAQSGLLPSQPRKKSANK
jgi:hypothetical protein